MASSLFSVAAANLRNYFSFQIQRSLAVDGRTRWQMQHRWVFSMLNYYCMSTYANYPDNLHVSIKNAHKCVWILIRARLIEWIYTHLVLPRRGFACTWRETLGLLKYALNIALPGGWGEGNVRRLKIKKLGEKSQSTANGYAFVRVLVLSGSELRTARNNLAGLYIAWLDRLGSGYLESRSLLIEQLFRGTSIFHDKFLPRARARTAITARRSEGWHERERVAGEKFVGKTDSHCLRPDGKDRDKIEPSIIVRERLHRDCRKRGNQLRDVSLFRVELLIALRVTVTIPT